MLTESKTISWAGTYGTTWAYNAADLPVSMTYPGDGETVAFDYNNQMLPEKLRDTKNTPGNPADDSFYVSSTIYDFTGRITSQTLGNGVMRNYQYFNWNTQGGRLEKMAAGTGTWDNASFNFTNNLQKLTYAYDPVGNITQITNNLTSVDEKQIYKYDKLDRLRCWGLTTRTGTSQCDTYDPSTDQLGTLQSGDTEYNYDAATGNLKKKDGLTLSYNDAAHKHAVTHIGTDQKYWYDANGNQTKRIVGPDTYDLVYDAENRLSQVKKNSTVIATFTYDGDGSRVKSVMGSETTVFIGGYYEVTNPGSGQTVTKYYFAGAQRVAMRKYVVPQAMQVEYFLGDHLGSTSITTDSAGTKISDIRYKPWGEIRSAPVSPPAGTSPAYKLASYTFTGQFSYMDDPNTGPIEGFGLMFYQARWYDPALGRFAQADTIVPGGVQGLDRYAYVNNSPMNFTDLTGHQCTPEDGCDTPSGDYHSHDPVALTEDAENLVKLSEQVGMTPSSVIRVGIAHEISGWANNDEYIEVYGVYLSNRFIWYAGVHCSGHRTYNCYLNFAVATHQSIKKSLVKTYLNNPQNFIEHEIDYWSHTYHDAAEKAMKYFWQRSQGSYDPINNKEDQIEGFNTGVIPRSQLDNALSTNKIPAGQFENYFLVKTDSQCGQIKTYSIIVSYVGNEYLDELKSLGLIRLADC